MKKSIPLSKAKAVALHYDEESAPRVIAKGIDERALLIKEAAERLGKPQLENDELAGLLLNLELDETIPEELYVGVAVVLSWAYWLTGKIPK
jgi:flagellar biosynthesis protein